MHRSSFVSARGPKSLLPSWNFSGPYLEERVPGAGAEGLARGADAETTHAALVARERPVRRRHHAVLRHVPAVGVKVVGPSLGFSICAACLGKTARWTRERARACDGETPPTRGSLSKGSFSLCTRVCLAKSMRPEREKSTDVIPQLIFSDLNLLTHIKPKFHEKRSELALSLSLSLSHQAAARQESSG